MDADDRLSLLPGDGEDPDAMGAQLLSLVGEAADLLRADERDHAGHAEEVIARVRREAAMTALVRAFGGAAARVVRSGPDLLGFGVQPDEEGV